MRNVNRPRQIFVQLARVPATQKGSLWLWALRRDPQADVFGPSRWQSTALPITGHEARCFSLDCSIGDKGQTSGV